MNESPATPRGSPEGGLSHADAALRLERDGPNLTPTLPPRTLAQVLRDQATSFIVVLLLGAGLLSFALGEPGQGVAILAALLLNGVVGAAMDYRSSKDVEALQALAAPHARVRRGGQEWDIPAAEVVVGDLLVVLAGDRIPADARLVEGALLQDESLLTGESVPIWRRAPEDRVHAGTLSLEGAALAVVEHTGARSEIGRIGRLMQETDRPPSPLQARLEGLGRVLIWTVALLAAGILAIGMAQQRPFWPLAQMAIALAIAAIPEGLPAVATLALSAGARRLAALGLQVRRLQTVETLGTIQVLCVDKTGTLTANQMAVLRLETPGSRLTVSGPALEPGGTFLAHGQVQEPGDFPAMVALLRSAQLCNNATYERSEEGWHVHGDPDEGALLVVAAKAKLKDPRPACARRWTIDPGPGRPWMAVCCGPAPDPLGGATVIAAKGAPEAILARCAEVISATDRASGSSRNLQLNARPLTDSGRRAWSRRSRAMARCGLRVFAVAARMIPATVPLPSPDQAEDTGWVFLGLIGMADPPRPEGRQAVRDLRQAGIRMVMVTGDHPATAAAIARRLELAGARPLKVDAGSSDPAPDSDVLARVTPEGKYRLVQALRERGQAVAMMGDGVNDAPALRAADVGIAMGGGAAVAKQAAEAILVEPRLDVLLGALLEGRTVFFNIQSAADYLITCSVATMLAVLIATVFGWPLPLSPLQILYLNLLIHTFPALGLALGEAEGHGPVPRRSLLLGRARMLAMLSHGLVIAVITLAVGRWGLAHRGLAHGQTLILVTIAMALAMHAFSDRRAAPFRGILGRGAIRLSRWVAIVLWLAIATSDLRPLSAVLGTSPLDQRDWLVALCAALASYVVIETSKWILPPDRG